MRMMPKRRNRRIDPAARRRPTLARLRQVVWLLGAAAACGVWLRFDSPLPETASMGVRLDPRVLLELELPHLEQLRLDWREPLRRPFLRLDRIHVFGLRSLDADALARQLGLSSELALVDVAPDAVCAELKAAGRIAACTALRVPPGTLAIALRERTPIAILESSGEGIASDGARFALLPGEADGLPRIHGDAERALPYVEAAARAGVRLHRIEARAATAPRPHYILWPVDAAVRILPGTDPDDSLLRYRALARTDVTHEPGMELDLRFRGRAFLRRIAPSYGDEGDEA